EILVLCADQIDFDQRIRHQQSGAADGGARRRLLEVALPHRIEAMEVVEVGEKHLRLGDLIERRAGGLEGLFQVVEDVCRLQLDIRAVERKAFLLARLRRNAGSIVARDLTGREYVAADLKSLAVVRERTRSPRLDDLVLKPGAVADKVDLHQRIFDQQASAANGRARRRDLEVPLPYAVEGVEVVEIRQKHLRLGHVLERRARRLEGLFQILQHVRAL